MTPNSVSLSCTCVSQAGFVEEKVAEEYGRNMCYQESLLSDTHSRVSQPGSKLCPRGTGSCAACVGTTCRCCVLA